MAVYPRKNEKGRVTSWQFHFYREGKSIRQAGFRTRNEALAAMEDMKTDVRRGVLRPAPHPSGALGFFDFAKEYLAWQKTRKRSWNRDKIALNHLLAYLQNRPLEGITAGDIEAYKVGRLSAGVTKSTVDRELCVLRHLFTTAVDWEKLDKSPVKSKLFYREQNTTRWHILTSDEEERLLAAADARLRPFMTFALYTGLRKSQVINLEWEHVDLVEERMTLPAAINKSKREHTLPLGPVALAVLKSLPRVSEYCFPYLSKSSVDYLFRQAVKKAGIPGKMRLHDLRHTFITRLSEAGNPIDRVRRLAQHSNLATTQRYMHGDEDGMREALQKLAPVVTSSHKSKSPEVLAHVLTHDADVQLEQHRNLPVLPFQCVWSSHADYADSTVTSDAVGDTWADENGSSRFI